MPRQRKSTPRSPDHAALGLAIELIIAETPNMSQESVARQGDLDIKQVGALVRGQSNPTYATMLKLCNGLHVRLGKLLTRADELREQSLSG